MAKINPKGGSAQTPPPNMGIETNERVPSLEETSQSGVRRRQEDVEVEIQEKITGNVRAS